MVSNPKAWGPTGEWSAKNSDNLDYEKALSRTKCCVGFDGLMNVEK